MAGISNPSTSKERWETETRQFPVTSGPANLECTMQWQRREGVWPHDEVEGEDPYLWLSSGHAHALHTCTKTSSYEALKRIKPQNHLWGNSCMKEHHKGWRAAGNEEPEAPMSKWPPTLQGHGKEQCLPLQARHLLLRALGSWVLHLPLPTL